MISRVVWWLESQQYVLPDAYVVERFAYRVGDGCIVMRVEHVFSSFLPSVDTVLSFVEPDDVGAPPPQ
jgi:hypothetical protein